ncbi:MAG: hypothetical protein IE927_16385, partial [Rhodobacterales bacterium]|nr:hypothetical protein [Rhodobacterales bacterium]
MLKPLSKAVTVVTLCLSLIAPAPGMAQKASLADKLAACRADATGKGCRKLLETADLCLAQPQLDLCRAFVAAEAELAEAAAAAPAEPAPAPVADAAPEPAAPQPAAP